MAHYSISESLESLVRLRELLPPGSVVHTVLRHVSRSGMSRQIDFYRFVPVVDQASTPANITDYPVRSLYLTFHIARVLGYPEPKSEGLLIRGTGMDMGFAVVHDLSYALHGRENVNVPDANRGKPFKPTSEAYRAGYSLQHRWI